MVIVIMCSDQLVLLEFHNSMNAVSAGSSNSSIIFVGFVDSFDFVRILMMMVMTNVMTYSTLL